MAAQPEAYAGLELGPIRPPSEARSLLIRVTRNCPWNRCTFCPVYKGETFSRRPVADVLRDIDTLQGYVEALQNALASNGAVSVHDIRALYAPHAPGSRHHRRAVHQAYNFVSDGMRSIFLQDANSLVFKPRDLTRILRHIRQAFPQVRRITSYARSRTVAALDGADLAEIADAGLNRIHIGMESGSDAVLAKVKKGSDKAAHIAAGQKVKQAGMELSEYVMPGLGGRALSKEHARETADALNRINPDYIRIRTLALPQGSPLAQAHRAGAFDKMDEVKTARELLALLEELDDIDSTVVSDHILNLFSEIEGTLPQNKSRMTAVVRRFLALPRTEQILYQIGRRGMVMKRLKDLENPDLRARAAQQCAQWGVTEETAETVVENMMKLFI